MKEIHLIFKIRQLDRETICLSIAYEDNRKIHDNAQHRVRHDLRLLIFTYIRDQRPCRWHAFAAYSAIAKHCDEEIYFATTYPRLSPSLYACISVSFLTGLHFRQHTY